MNLTKLAQVLLIAVLMALPLLTHAQQSVGIGTNTPNPRSVLQLVSPGQNQGFLLPRLSTIEINTIPLVAADRGLMVFDNTTAEIKYWDGALWQILGSGGASTLDALTDVTLTTPATGNFLRYNGTDWVNTSSIFPINVTTAAAGTQFQLNQTGPGTTFRITNSSPLSTDFVMSVEALGDAIAGYFVKNSPTSTNQALYTHTLGTGPALVSFGLGNNSSAARFANTSATNIQPTVIIENAGTGLGLNLVSGAIRVNSFGGGGTQMVVTNNTGVLGTAAIPASQWLNNASDIYYSTGNVGIGTSTIDGRLHVAEVVNNITGDDGAFVNIQNSTPLGTNGIMSGVRFKVDGTNVGLDSRYKAGILFRKTGLFGVGDLILATNSSADNSSISAADARILIQSTGNVGIGTSNPTALLEVAGSTRIGNGLTVLGIANTLFGGNAAIDLSNTTAGILISDDGGLFDYNDGYVTYNGAIGLKIAGNSGSLSSGQLWVNGQFRLSNGTEGLGRVLVSDATGLSTWASTNSFSWGLAGNAGTNPATNFLGTTDAQDLSIRTNNLGRMNIMASGEIGIGVNAPSQQLDVLGRIASRRMDSSAFGVEGGSYRIQEASYVNTLLGSSGYWNLSTGAFGNPIANYFYIENQRTSNIGFRVYQSGNVGIGPIGFSDVITESLGIEGNFSVSNTSNNFKTIFNPGVQSSDINYTLPIVQGSANHVLTNDGSGILSWQLPSGSGWGLTGNLGTNPATNFIGTTDAQPLNFRTNNLNRLTVSETGKVMINENSTFEDYSLQVQAGQTAGLDNGILIRRNSFNNFSNASIAFKTFTFNGDSSSGLISIKNDELLDRGLQFMTTTGGLPPNAILFNFLDPTTARVMSILRNGNTAIGNVTPTERLQVDGNVRFSGALMPNNLSGAAGDVLTSAGPGLAPTWSPASGSGWGLSGNTLAGGEKLGSINGNSLTFITNNADRMTIDPAGNVGIGTATPFSTLQVGTKLGIFTDPSSPQEVITNNIYNDGTDFRYVTTNPASALTLGNERVGLFTFPSGTAGNILAGSPSMRFNLTTLGLGIQVDNPQEILHVNGATMLNPITAPGVTTDRLYNVAGNLFWNGTNISGGGFTTLNSIPKGDGSGLVPSLISDNGSAVTITSSDIGANIFNVINTASSANINIQGTSAGGSLIRLSAGLQQTFVWSGSGNLFMDANAGTLHLQTLGTDRLHINNLGNIGIGNSSPTQRLDITGNMRLSGAFMPNNQSGTAGQVLTSAGPGVPPTWSAAGGSGWGLTGNTLTGTERLGSDNAQPLVFETNNTEAMRIDAFGNLGIGTAAPTVALSVAGPVAVDFAGANIGDIDNSLVFGQGFSGEGIGSKRNAGTGQFGLDFYTASANRMHISNTGSVGIGTTTPRTDLQLGDRIGLWRLNLFTPGTVLSSNIYLDGATPRYITNAQATLMSFSDEGSGNRLIFSMYPQGNAGDPLGTEVPLFYVDSIGKGYLPGGLTINGPLEPNFTPGNVGDVLTSAGPGAPPTWSAAGGSGWGLTGNAGTNSAVNFIGTTDNVALTFRVNNNLAGRIDPVTFNTTYGSGAGSNLTTGFNNNFFGLNSGVNNSIGSQNTGFGDFALSSNNGNQNTAIGYVSLTTNTTGTGNTAVGFGADVTLGNLTNATAIGASAVVSASNSLVLGNNANVGIGVSAPNAKLQVQGPGNFDIANTEGDFKVGNATHRFKIGIAYGGGGAGDIYLGAQGGTSRLFIGGGATLADFQTLTVASGNVGIGTTTPTERLHVNGNAFFQNDIRFAQELNHLIKVADRTGASQTGNALTILGSNGGFGGFGVSGGSVTIQGGDAYNIGGSGTGGDVFITGGGNYGSTDNPGSIVMSTRIGTTTNERMRILGNGNVGIGTTTPGALLDVNNAFNGIRVNNWLSAGSSVCGIGYVGSNLYRNNSDNVWRFTNSNGTIGGTAINFNDCSGTPNQISFVRALGPSTANALATVVESMRIDQNGRVGIGTSAPQAPLDVTFTQNIFLSPTGSTFFNSFNGGTLSCCGNPTPSVAVRATGAFLSIGTGEGAGYYVQSDERIKRMVGLSDSRNDLSTLMKVKITDYRYTDSLSAGNIQVKGVFAQQVEEVYPQAVSKQTNFIPNVYALALELAYDETNQTLKVTMNKPHELVVGDKVKLISKISGEKPATVTAVAGNSFTVSDWTEQSDKVFVYGKEVQDFRIVDYDRLFTLNLSATQELVKMLDEQGKMMDDMRAKAMESNSRISVLEANVSTLEKEKVELQKLKLEIERIKSALGIDATGAKK